MCAVKSQLRYTLLWSADPVSTKKRDVSWDKCQCYQQYSRSVSSQSFYLSSTTVCDLELLTDQADGCGDVLILWVGARDAVGFSDCSDRIRSPRQPDRGRDAVGFSDCSDPIISRREPDPGRDAVGFCDCSDQINSPREPDPRRDAVGFSDCSDRIRSLPEPDWGQEPLTTPVMSYLLGVGESQSLLFSSPPLIIIFF